jgi:hypothetical protein
MNSHSQDGKAAFPAHGVQAACATASNIEQQLTEELGDESRVALNNCKF